jgi:hypothetical protein
VDSPKALTWTGFLGKLGGAVSFTDGSRLEEVSFTSPEGMFEPMTKEEGYLAFSLYAEDGKPLAECTRAALSIMSTSFNSGFVPPPEELEVKYRPAGGKRGDLPVQVSRVGATLRCSVIDGMRYVIRDWHMDEIGSGTVTDGTLVIPGDKPVFVIQLER